MKTIMITDLTTNLAKALIEQKEIYVINTNKSPIGEIMFAIDKLMSAGFDIIYLASNKGYPVIKDMCEKEIKIHSNNSATVINIESATIGKNNFVLKLASTENINEVVVKYQGVSSIFFDKAYSEAINAKPILY